MEYVDTIDNEWMQFLENPDVHGGVTAAVRPPHHGIINVIGQQVRSFHEQALILI